MKRAPLIALVAAASVALATPALAAPGGDPGKPDDRPSAQPVDTPATSPSGNEVASYIVQFTPGSDRAAEVAKAKALGMEITYVYDAAFSGMAVKANQGQVTALQKNPNVALVEADAVMTTQASQTSPPSWGLDRIDQNSLPLNSTYGYTRTGSGVTAYIIDTGIRATHTDLGGRVRAGYDAFTDGQKSNDCNGHGTHVAGTVGGATYGVAKAVNLVAVRVLDCSGSGSASGLIAGINWVISDHGSTPAVANMSLGFGAGLSSVDTAVANLVADNVTVAVAAGNSNRDACQFSPARASTAITVGATTSTDARASYSNYGRCLDIFAPGSAITSAWYTGDSDKVSISGTSMASPHVAGAAARILEANPTWTPKQVTDSLVASASANKVSSPGKNSPNRLLFMATGS